MSDNISLRNDYTNYTGNDVSDPAESIPYVTTKKTSKKYSIRVVIYIYQVTSQ